MTPLAILFMSVALLGVTALTAWCYIRVLTDKSAANRRKDPH